MLVYVFWHQPKAGIALDEYAGALLAFESVFKAQGDVEEVQSFRMESVPWFGGGAKVYTDWYSMTDSSKLDPVTQHAVTGACEKPHLAIAAMTGSGTGSLYDVTYPGCTIGEARYGVWLAKPNGMSYSDFRAKMSTLETEGVCLLQRRMALGPSPEFCVLSVESVKLPDGLSGETRALAPIGSV
jgi:hypothetical protein